MEIEFIEISTMNAILTPREYKGISSWTVIDMKRYPNKYPIIKKIHPKWSWKECRFCRARFKKEDGWEIQDTYFVAGVEATKYYACMDCCPTEESAYKHTREGNRPPKMK